MLFLPGAAHPETISWVASEGYDDIHHYRGGRGADLGFASAGLCTPFASQAFLPSPPLLEQNLSQPTQDVGGESKARESTVDCVSNQQKRYF